MINFRPGVIPTPPHVDRLFAEDYMPQLTSAVLYSDYSGAKFPMYLNDQIGDCTCAGIGHVYGAASYYGSGEKNETLFTDQDILSLYEKVSGYQPGNPASDVGATLESVLAEVYAHGLAGAKPIVGYSQIRNTTTAGISQALRVYDSVYCAVNLPQSAEDQFNAGKPWTYVPGSPIAGGHCICLQRVLNAVPNCLGFATWGAVQPTTQQWWSHYQMEAWAVQVNPNPTSNLSVHALKADMLAIKGV